MKANELRIGSIVKSLVNDEDFSIVEEIGHRASLGYYVSLNNQHSGVWLEHKERDLILGIPLTEEWLIKFGFIKEEKFVIDKDKYNTISIVNTNNFWMPFIKSNHHEAGESFSFYGIKHVHTLQNLYFALTNEELTMK